MRVQYNAEDGDWMVVNEEGEELGGASRREMAERMVEEFKHD